MATICPNCTSMSQALALADTENAALRARVALLEQALTEADAALVSLRGELLELRDLVNRDYGTVIVPEQRQALDEVRDACT